MPVILLKFLKFAGGGLMRFLPVIGIFAQNLFTKIGKNKQLMKFLPIVAIGLAGLYWFYTREEKLLIEDLKASGDAKKEALMITKFLGTHKNLGWFDWSKWSEDEVAVIDLLSGTKTAISEIAREYDKVSKSGDFLSDMHRLLSGKELDQFLKLV